MTDSDMDAIYYEKYLNYKKKYMELKELEGGAESGEYFLLLRESDILKLLPFTPEVKKSLFGKSETRTGNTFFNASNLKENKKNINESIKDYYMIKKGSGELKLKNPLILEKKSFNIFNKHKSAINKLITKYFNETLPEKTVADKLIEDITTELRKKEQEERHKKINLKDLPTSGIMSDKPLIITLNGAVRTSLPDSTPEIFVDVVSNFDDNTIGYLLGKLAPLGFTHFIHVDLGGKFGKNKILNSFPKYDFMKHINTTPESAPESTTELAPATSTFSISKKYFKEITDSETISLPFNL